MYKDLMLDLETLDDGSDATIISIGAVVFNLDTFDDIYSVQYPERTFYTVVDTWEQGKHGRTMNAETVLWWFQQNDAARQAVCKSGLRLEPALRLLHAFAKDNEVERLWGYGATFDNVIINNACKAYGIKPIVSYRNNMCMRTIVNLSGMGRPDDLEGLTAHHALADAQRQVIWLQRAYRALRGLPDHAV